MGIGAANGKRSGGRLSEQLFLGCAQSIGVCQSLGGTSSGQPVCQPTFQMSEFVCVGEERRVRWKSGDRRELLLLPWS